VKYIKSIIIATMMAVSCSQVHAINLEDALTIFIKSNQKKPALYRIHRYIDSFVSNSKLAGMMPELKIQDVSLKSMFEKSKKNLLNPPLNTTGIRLMTKYLAIISQVATAQNKNYKLVEQEGNEIFITLMKNRKLKKANL